MTVSREPVPGHDPLEWRGRFPILADTNYLASHSLGPMPAAAGAALARYASEWSERGVRAWSEGWWESPRVAASLLARLLGAPEDSVAMLPNASAAQGLVATALDFTRGRRKIICVQGDFPSVHYVWDAQRKRGAELVEVPLESDGELRLERLLETIDEQTLVVPISHVLYKSSQLLDVAAVCARAQEVGALSLIDAYQSLGTVPLDVCEWGADLVCGGSVKWLCAGPGAGYLYARSQVLSWLEPALTGWAAHAEPFGFEPPPMRYAAGASRLLSGTPAVPALLGAVPGYELVLEVGVGNIRAHSLRLTERLREGLQERGLQSVSLEDPDRRGGVLTVPTGSNELAVSAVEELARRGIIVDQRPGAGVRVGPHYFTTSEEIDQCIAALTELLLHGGTQRAQSYAGGGA